MQLLLIKFKLLVTTISLPCLISTNGMKIAVLSYEISQSALINSYYRESKQTQTFHRIKASPFVHTNCAYFVELFCIFDVNYS